jgi:hypothetical protein
MVGEVFEGVHLRAGAPGALFEVLEVVLHLHQFGAGHREISPEFASSVAPESFGDESRGRAGSPTKLIAKPDVGPECGVVRNCHHLIAQRRCELPGTQFAELPDSHAAGTSNADATVSQPRLQHLELRPRPDQPRGTAARTVALQPRSTALWHRGTAALRHCPAALPCGTVALRHCSTAISASAGRCASRGRRTPRRTPSRSLRASGERGSSA